MSEANSDLRDALSVGTVVGEYKVEALLGHGGYSIVYRARHVELGHVVALKEYLPADLAVRDRGTVFPRSTESTSHYEDGRRRFLEEAKSIVQFRDDPGVVSCLGFFRTNGTAYIVLEYIKGMPLSELLRRREAVGNPLDESELRALVLPLLETLMRLHGADVLHRDIKPSNILVRRSDSKPVLIDFGAAKQQTALHSKSVAPFTEGYAALEQVGEGELGTWTDVYAVGAVMWRIVAGANPPWDPPNPKRVELRAAAVLTGKADPLLSAVELGKGRFSTELLVVIDNSLRIQGNKRIPDCSEVRRAIEGERSTFESRIPNQLGQAPSELQTTEVNKHNRIVEFSATGPQVRPWVRFFARMIDNTFLQGVVWFMLSASFAALLGNYYQNPFIDGPNIVELIVGYFLATFLESWMLSNWGCTFGKWICNVRVRRNNGEYLSYRQALRRSILVLIRGLWFGLPIINLIPMLIIFGRFRNNGITSWDRDCASIVLHKELGFGRTILTIFLVILILILSSIFAN